MPAKFAGAVRLYYTAELISVLRKKSGKKDKRGARACKRIKKVIKFFYGQKYI